MQKVEKSLSKTEGSNADDKPQKKPAEIQLVEAALYVAGRPLDINELCRILNTRSKKRARRLVSVLLKDYADRNSPLEVLELKDERYVLQLKSEFTPLVKRLVNRPLLSTGPLKTLSYVAYRQPVFQKRVVEVRGHHAYGHIKLLKEMGLIASERSGRSQVLRTTEYFADYFAFSHDTGTMKRELKRIFSTMTEPET